MIRKTALLGVVLSCCLTGTTQAAFISFGPLTVLGTDAPTTGFGGAGSTVGPSFTLAAGTVGTDVLAVEGVGTVSIDPTAYTTNGAGIMVAPASGGAFGGSPGSVNPSGGLSSPPGLPPGGFPIGAILIGNSTLGWFPLFPANAANGLGNSTPPTTVATLPPGSGPTLSTLFGIAAPPGGWGGVTLQLVVNDGNGQYGNNGGSIRVTAVPEPSSIVLAGMGGALALLGVIRSRRRVQD